ncbi:MAG: hypothetical protein KBI24_04100 [Selenomonas sp.]|nr:hypothetical protein [Selenomonas sp.]
MKMQWGAALMAAAMIFVTAPQADADEAIPETVYQWVQSTSRQNYYFNKQQMYFAADAQGNMNVDVLLVPILKTYDQVQKQDVISKRRWKMLSTDGYDDLVGDAEYLSFNLKDQTVQVTRHEDLDSEWGVLATTNPTAVTKISDLSDKDVDGVFYRAILNYANSHIDEIVERTQSSNKAQLTDAARAKLAAMKNPAGDKAGRALRTTAGTRRN